MGSLRDTEEWARVTDALEGDREASPILATHELLESMREEALAAIAGGRERIARLEEELRRLDEGIDGLELQATELAARRERIRRLEGELRGGLDATIERARGAASVRPPEPIPVERLLPGFALGARVASLLPGQEHRRERAGVRNARGVARAMIERIEKARQEKG